MADIDPAGEGEELRTVDGRVPGRRGRETRQRLLQTTADMLASGSYRDLAVVDIAREAGVSPATFYQYFNDVESAIFFIADFIADDGNRRLTELVENVDLEGDAFPGSVELAQGFLQLWREYAFILRVLDLGSAESDGRFRDRRTQLLAGPTTAFRTAIEKQQADGRVSASVDPAATAGVLIAMLSHVAAHRSGLRDWGAAEKDLVAAMARVVAWTLTESPPSA